MHHINLHSKQICLLLCCYLVGWLDACRILICVALALDLIGFIMVTFGIQTLNFEMKYKYYNISIIILFLAGKHQTCRYNSVCVAIVVRCCKSLYSVRYSCT